MNKLYKYLVSILLTIYFSLSFLQDAEAQNPRIKINYKVQRGMVRSFNTATSTIQNTGGACSEASRPELRVHARLRSNNSLVNGNNASYNATNTCPSGTCNTCITGDATLGWSCEQRCESPGTTSASTCETCLCGVWINNFSNNTTYVGDPGYVDTSAYPSNDILEVQMKGFESDNFNSIVNSDKVNFNFHDGSCQASCSNGNCYGNYQIPTSGRYTTVDIGAVGNTVLPHKGSNWSSYIDAAYEGTACALDLTGFYSYYYIQWQYRWCWDSTTLNNTHAGLIKIPSTPFICSGSVATIADSAQAFEAARGFSDYQWQYSTNGTTWTDIAGATTKDLSTSALTNVTTAPITYQLRRVGLFCVDFRSSALYRKYPVYSNIQQVIVYPQPIAPTLNSATPANGSTICKGTFVYAQVNGGTGGFTDATNEYQYTLNNGTSWLTYTPPSGINTTSATSTIIVRARRTGGSLSGCTASAWSNIVSWNISTITPPSLNTATPTNNSTICTPYDVSATFNAGSGGGTSDEFRYSINNGTSWSSYNAGTNINTTGATTKILIQGRIIGGPAPCNPPTFTTLAEWTPISQISNPTLLSKIPNKDSVCISETSISANFNAGSGGSSIARDSFQLSVDNGSSWSVYIPNTNISLLSTTDSILIRGKRIDNFSFGCSLTEWDTLNKWYVQKLPTGTPSIDKIYICDASAKLRINNLLPANSNVSWNRISGAHLPITSSDSTFVISGTGTSQYNALISSGACQNINIGNVAVTTNLITATSNISTTDNCQYCIVQDGSTRLFFDNNGDLVAEIKDLNIPTTYLDETEICMRVNPSQLHIIDNFGDNQPYLRRQWTITPKNNNTNVEVKLFFTDTELTDLRNACSGTPYQFSAYNNLMITKYYGGGNGNFTPPKSIVEELIMPTFTSLGAGKHQLTFQTNKFSTIYVHPTRGYYAVLPIELIYFIGESNEQSNVLKWQTASEINFDRFELEKSKNATNWQTISTINGNGEQTQLNNYSYVDNSNILGINYYRLKMIDKDNTYKYSDIVKLNNNYDNSLITVYPNPASSYLNIISEKNILINDITITDAIGKEIHNYKIDQINAQNIAIDINNLSKGVYYIKIKNNTQKVIKN